MAFRGTSATRKKLSTLCADTIRSFGDATFKKSDVVEAAMPSARAIAAGDYDEILRSDISYMIGSQLRRGQQGEHKPSSAPMLIPGLELPYRIAVPPVNATDPEDDAEKAEAEINWIALHKATIAEALRHCDMLLRHIDATQVNHDRVRIVCDTALSKCHDTDVEIGKAFAMADA